MQCLERPRLMSLISLPRKAQPLLARIALPYMGAVGF